MVHALSHSLPGGTSHSSEGDKRKQAPAKVCDTCLALAQMGAALPSSFLSFSLDASVAAANAAIPVSATTRVAGAYDARAPPAELT